MGGGGHFNDFPGDFVTQDARGGLQAIPFEDVCAADAAGEDLDEHLAGAETRDGHLFEADVAILVVHRDAHAGWGLGFRV